MRLVASLAWCGVLLGCAGDTHGAELLTLGAVSPTVLDEGTELTIEADGVPSGTEGTLRFEGTLWRPSAGVLPVRVDVPLEVREGSLVAQIDAAAIEALGGRGTFRGTVEVRLPSPLGGLVTGRRELELDVGHTATERPGRAVHHATSVALETLGLVLTADPPLEGGVAVESVHGPLEHAGLRSGDRIVTWAGVHVRDLTDLRSPSAARFEVGFHRPERARLFVAEVSFAAPVRESHLGLWVLALLLGLAVSFGPLAQVFRTRPRRRVAAVVSNRSPRPHHWRGRDALAAAVALPVLALPIDGLIWLGAGLLISLAAALEGHEPLRALFQALRAEVGLWLIVFGAAFLLGTTHTAGALVAQSEGVGDWLAVRTPLSLLLVAAAPLVLVTGPAARRPGLRMLGRVRSWIGSALVVVMLFGGGGVGTPYDLGLGLTLTALLLGASRAIQAESKFFIPSAAFAFAGVVGAGLLGLDATPAALDGTDARPFLLLALVVGGLVGYARTRLAPASRWVHLHL